MFRLWFDFVLSFLFFILMSGAFLAYLIGTLDFQTTVVLITFSIAVPVVGAMFRASLNRLAANIERSRRT